MGRKSSGSARTYATVATVSSACEIRTATCVADDVSTLSIATVEITILPLSALITTTSAEAGGGRNFFRACYESRVPSKQIEGEAPRPRHICRNAESIPAATVCHADRRLPRRALLCPLTSFASATLRYLSYLPWSLSSLFRECVVRLRVKEQSHSQKCWTHIGWRYRGCTWS
jgi:hypothetical protein